MWGYLVIIFFVDVYGFCIIGVMFNYGVGKCVGLFSNF